MAKPLMAKATAVWLVDNTTISFKQIADFVEMHELGGAGHCRWGCGRRCERVSTRLPTTS